MKKGIFAIALVAALAFVGAQSHEAEAGTPFFVQIGGPRGGLSIGTGYGGFRGPYGYRRAYPFGVTRGYSSYRVPHHLHHPHHGYGGRGYGYGGRGYGHGGGFGYGGGCYR